MLLRAIVTIHALLGTINEQYAHLLEWFLAYSMIPCNVRAQSATGLSMLVLFSIHN